MMVHVECTQNTYFLIKSFASPEGARAGPHLSRGAHLIWVQYYWAHMGPHGARIRPATLLKGQECVQASNLQGATSNVS